MRSSSKLNEYPVPWSVVILLLAVAGGGIDGVVFLGFRVMAGAQTGNTILLGADIATGQLATAVGCVVSVVAYLIGVGIGEIIVEQDDTESWTSAVSAVLMVELVLLGSLLVFWHLAYLRAVSYSTYLVIASAAIAMGLQSAAMLPLGNGPKTTYITGTLTSIATNLIRQWGLFSRAPKSATEQRKGSVIHTLSTVEAPWIHAISWIAYLVGAFEGGIFFLHRKEIALLIPTLAVLAAVIVASYNAGRLRLWRSGQARQALVTSK